MRGTPKHLNTKFDYEFIRKNNYSNWQNEYQKLLNGYMAWQVVAFLENEEDGIENDTHRIHVQKETDPETNEEKTVRVQLEWKVDPKCKLLRLGFTKDEVQEAIDEYWSRQN